MQARNPRIARSESDACTPSESRLSMSTAEPNSTQAARDFAREFSVLQRFTEVYCRKHHERASGSLCDECANLLRYARRRVEACPYDPKPKCKDCPTHCYSAANRQRIREIMRFSGMYYVKRGRIDWLLRYFWM